MSHEIRTPLNAIICMTNIALKDPIPDATKKHLEVVKNASDVLLDVINNILDMSKIEAANGRVAVQTPHKYDLILMDIQIPELGGYSATKAIRELDIQVPIIAMTAHAFKEDEAKSIECGMNGHLSKPIDSKNLLKIIVQFVL